MVIALDLGDDNQAFAKEPGACHAVESDRAAAAVKGAHPWASRRRGVLDFIGSELTGTMAVRCAAVGGSVVVLGAGDGACGSAS